MSTLLKSAAFAAALAPLASFSQASIVGFTETFDSPTIDGADAGALEFGNGSTARTFGGFATGNNGNTVNPGVITFGTGGANNLRGISTVLDLDGTAAGDLQVNFDFSASNFVVNTGNGFAGVGFAVISGVTTAAGGGVTLDTHNGGVSLADFVFLGDPDPTVISGAIDVTGTASIVSSGFQTIDPADILGTTSLNVTLAAPAGPGDVLALVVIRNGGADGGSGGTFDLDTLSVVPEPSSLALVGLAGLCMVGRRRK